MPTRTMDDQPGMDGAVDETVQKGKHGRHKRYLLQNLMVNHPIPRLDDGRWVVPKDAMPSLRKGWYDKTNSAFCMTVRYRVCFVPTPVRVFLMQDSNQPNPRHVVFNPMENSEGYAKFVQNKIFMGTGKDGFVTHASQALNESISDLTESQPDAEEFRISNQLPRTKDDVMKLLFDKNGPCMKAIQEKNYGLAVAQVLKFASSVTRMGSNPDRYVDGIYKWRDKKEYNFVLGENVISGRRMELHGLVSIARRVSCNVYYTAVVAKMAAKWRLKLHRDRRPGQRNPGEFVVNVGHHLPRKLREVFREEQVVSFVANSDIGRADRDVLKESEDSMEAIVAEMASNGVSKESVDQICFDVTQRVYNESWEGGSNNAVQPAIQPGATTPETPRRSPRRQPPIQPAATRPETPRRSPRKKTRTEVNLVQDYQQNSDGESEEGLLKERTPSGKKVKFARVLGRRSWCCKHAWTKSEECRLAYCMKCKPVMMAKGGNVKQGSNSMLGKTVLCCDKGECGSHTLADMGDLIEMGVENGYLRSVRRKKNENGWKNMPETCWNCGDLF